MLNYIALFVLCVECLDFVLSRQRITKVLTYCTDALACLHPSCIHSAMSGFLATRTIPYGPRREKTCLRGFVNNTGAVQPAHLRRLISAFVIRFLESIISKHSTREISIFYLVSVAEETGLILTLSGPPKTGFLATRPI